MHYVQGHLRGAHGAELREAARMEQAAHLAAIQNAACPTYAAGPDTASGSMPFSSSEEQLGLLEGFVELRMQDGLKLDDVLKVRAICSLF